MNIPGLSAIPAPSKRTLLILAAVVALYFFAMREPQAKAATAKAPDTGIKSVTPPAKKKPAFKPPAQGTTAVTVLPASQAAREEELLRRFMETSGTGTYIPPEARN